MCVCVCVCNLLQQSGLVCGCMFFFFCASFFGAVGLQSLCLNFSVAVGLL